MFKEQSISPVDAFVDQLHQTTHPLVMGVLNITPDSFSDGGINNSLSKALRHARLMVEEGADILDVGGESTRPGAGDVALDEELARVIPVIELLTRELDVPVSIDTSKAGVMTAAVNAGAAMINDVNALQSSGALPALVKANVPVCLMHMLGSPRTMQTNPQYQNVVSDIIVFLRDRANQCVRAGVDPSKILLDPGFGFGKTASQNYRLLSELNRFKTVGFPVLVGMSRKSMIGDLLGIPVKDRKIASVVLAAMAIERGASIVRVHDVAETVQAIRLVKAVANPDLIHNI